MASTTEPPSPSPQGADDIKPIVAEQPRSTGDRWTDFKLAARRISLKDDLKHIGEVPCARSSLLMGIGAGAGIGVVRGFNSKLFVAANWAMGTFLLVSVGAWNVCRSSIQREREQVRVVVEQMAQRRMRRADQDGKVDGDQAGKL